MRKQWIYVLTYLFQTHTHTNKHFDVWNLVRYCFYVMWDISNSYFLASRTNVLCTVIAFKLPNSFYSLET